VRIPRAAGTLRTMWLRRTYPFVSFGKGSWAHYSFHVDRASARFISIGENVALARGARLDACPAPGTDGPVLIVEGGCGVQRECVISARFRIHVERNVIFGPSVVVMDHSDAEGDAISAADGRRAASGGAIRIEEGCWIGFGSRIVCEEGELVIGRNSVLGANSVITGSVPPYSVVMGNPPTIVRQYDTAQGKWVLGSIRRGDGPEAPANRSALS